MAARIDTSQQPIEITISQEFFVSNGEGQQNANWIRLSIPVVLDAEDQLVEQQNAAILEQADRLGNLVIEAIKQHTFKLQVLAFDQQEGVEI